MLDVFFLSVTHAYPGIENPNSPIRSRTYYLPSTSSDALALSYRRLLGTNSSILKSYQCLGCLSHEPNLMALAAKSLT